MNFSNIGSSNVREVNLIMYREVRKNLISQSIKVLSQLKGQTKNTYLTLSMVRDMVILLGLSP